MKIWIALSKGWRTEKSPYGQISTGAICPPRTKEMVEDNIFWYEADILREMNVPVQNEYERDAILYNWRR